MFSLKKDSVAKNVFMVQLHLKVLLVELPLLIKEDIFLKYQLPTFPRMILNLKETSS